MDQVAGKISKNQDDSPIECKQPTLLHLPCPGEEAGGLDSPTSPTKVSNTSETSSIPSSESYYNRYKLPDDSPELYRKFESAVIEYVNINPPSGSAEYDRLEGEMYAACGPGYTREYIMKRLLFKPLDYTDVSLYDGTTWPSALHSAARLGSAVICDILLSSGKCLDVNRRDPYRHQTPLMAACAGWSMTPTETKFCDRAGVMRHLISHRADLHAKDKRGRTALQWALENGNHDCAKLLLQAGCSISDLKDAERGGLIEKMIQDQSRDASKYMKKLQERSGKSRRPGAPSPLQVVINLLGDSGAGKSSVAASLEEKRPIRVPESARTVGTELKQRRAHGIDFLIYDFGGHGSYSFLHHLHLPQYGIHVVFIKIEREFDEKDCALQLNRWMYFLSSKIPGPRVLVVLSKVDTLHEDDLEKAVRGLQLQIRLIKDGEHELIEAWSSSNKSALSSLKIDGKKLTGYDSVKKNLENAETVKRLQPKFLGDVMCVSCEVGKDRGLDEFLNRCATAVKEADIESMDGSRSYFRLSDFPESWEVFLEALLKCRGNGRLAIPMSEVCQKAAEAGVPKEDVDECLFLFKVRGHILHYECSEQELNRYVFHDPELLAKSMGQLVHHNLKEQFEVYIRSLTSVPEGDSIRSDFENGWVPYHFIKLQLSEKFQSEGDRFAEAIVQLASHIGFCITVDKLNSRGRQMVFVPSLVTRSCSEEDLSKKWGPAKMNGWDDFVMDLRLHKGLPIGFVERINLEASVFTTENFNFLNGFFARGWNRCLLLLKEVSESSNKFSRLRFKVRVESSNRVAAIQNMTWFYYVIQTVLSYYPGVLGDVVTPCDNCGEHAYFVKECLTRSHEELKKVLCPKCPMWEHHSAADVFPVTITGAAVADSHKERTIDATSITETPILLSGEDVNPSDVYLSKCDPKDFGMFANWFGDRINKTELGDMARYLFNSSALLFGSIKVLSADDLIKYEEGNKKGSQLITSLKDGGVITKMSDGTFNYNGLARILFRIDQRRLCDQLLQRQPAST